MANKVDDDGRLEVTLNEVWRTCRKIYSTIFRYGFDICSEFCKHDPRQTGLVSESVFTGILARYKSVVGLSDFEIREVTDYFRLRDGRVAYSQFCRVVLNEKTTAQCLTKNLTNGLEWNDPMHVNVIAHPEDRRRLCLILLKIAQFAHLPLLPYFQDYEIISHHAGAVTISHFSRVLHFMKIPLSDEEFLLVLKRYLKDGYLVNYVAFLKHLQNIMDYFHGKNLLNNANILIKDFPGRLVDLELPELPPIDGTELSRLVFPDDCHHQRNNKSSCELLFCIQKFVHKNRVRVSEFLECFDLLRTGTITVNQFERALSNIGVLKFLNQRDFEILCTRYVDPIDTNRIIWPHFRDEVDEVFTIKNLDKMPTREVKSPPKHIKKMAREGALEWSQAPEETRDLCEEVLSRIQLRIRNRRLHLHPFFKNYDKINHGHVRCNQANQIFLTNGILLSDNELAALKARFGNELGFNYTKFLELADPAEYAIPKMKEPSSMKAICPSFDDKDKKEPEEFPEEYIIQILSEAKRQAITKSIPVIDFLQDFDRHREGEVLEVDFRRGLDTADIKLPPEHVDALCKIFRSPRRACCVLYRDFCRALAEIFIQLEPDQSTDQMTAVPLIHLANLDCLMCALNFDERTTCTKALMKLARQPDEISNLRSVFKDFDRENCGSVTQNQFMRALTVRDMHYMCSSRELEAVQKCFGVQRGIHLEFNYREFLNVLNVLFRTGQIKRNC